MMPLASSLFRMSSFILAILLATGSSASAQAGTRDVVVASQAFLATLDEGQRQRVLFAFDDEEQRVRWSNLPAGIFERAGLRLGELSDAQSSAALSLLASALSGRGFEKILQIIEAEEVLRTTEGAGRRPQFGRDYYSISILGSPSEAAPWMIQFGGHHLAVNVTVAGQEGILTPTLTGAQPARYTVDGRTVRPLGAESDKALTLVGSLNDVQRGRAVLGYRVADLVLGPGHDGQTIQPEGIRASDLSSRQQTLLLDLIAEWAGIVREAAAERRMAEIASTLDDTWFAWSGPTTAEPGQNITAYYRIQGPTLVIEYAPQAMGGDPSMHVHTMYRDPTNDYGGGVIGP